LHVIEYRNLPKGRLASVVRNGDAWLMTFSDWSGEHKTWRLKQQLSSTLLDHALDRAERWCNADDDPTPTETPTTT